MYIVGVGIYYTTNNPNISTGNMGCIDFPTIGRSSRERGFENT
jgi:hypothetical protein